MKKKLKIKLQKIETPEEAYARGYADATIKYLQEDIEKKNSEIIRSKSCAACIPPFYHDHFILGGTKYV